jgi:hypothetical protein
MYSDERILSSDRLARTREWFSVGGQPNGLVVLSLLDHIDALAEQLAAAEGRAVEADELLYLAWGVIANVRNGNWEGESDEWQAAAVRWRDRWSASIAPARATGEEVDRG